MTNRIKAAQKAADKSSGRTLKQISDRIAQLLLDKGIDVDDVGEIQSVTANDWQGFFKNELGEAEKVDLQQTKFVFTPSWETGPEWPVVQPAKPTVVKPAAVKAKKTGRKRALILPDPQIGYRMYEDGELDPFHDEAAMNVAMQLCRDLQPDLIVNLGDLLDFAVFGRFEQEAAFAYTTQPTLDRAHLFLAEQRAASPDAEIVLLEGNHDRRLPNFITKNALAAFGLRKANQPESWPVLSVPYLLRLDELGIEYVDGYPAGEYWINDNLVAIHGAKVRSAGSTANAVIDDERVSVIFGHVHRIEMIHKTRRTRTGRKQNFAATPGCLSRLDGAVPSTKGSTDIMGRPVQTFENWQHGVAIVEYEEGDGKFDLDIRPIIDGELYYQGREYSAN